MYGDNHQIYTTGTQSKQMFKSETEKVTQWYKVNLLKANPRKYQIIAIYRTPFVR